jgi:transcriptional regulator with XRE-family HTH domain
MPRTRNPFGKEIAKLRIDRGMLLKEFANLIGVSASRLSNVEFGERPVPEDWFNTICTKLELTLPEMANLKKAILRSKRTYRISVENDEQREVLVAFIENLENIDHEKSKMIIEAVTHTGTGNKETERVCRKTNKTAV